MLGTETTRVDAFVRAGAKGWPWLAGSMRRLRAARGNEVYDLDIMKNVVVEAARYINCLIDPWAIAAECKIVPMGIRSRQHKARPKGFGVFYPA